MILPVLDCTTGVITIFELVTKPVRRLHVVTPIELAQRGLRAYGLATEYDDELAEMAACGMLRGSEDPILC